MTRKVVVGKIIAPFGIKGDVKVISFCENPAQFEKYTLFNEKNEILKLKITNKNKVATSFTKSGDAIFNVRIEGVENRNQSEILKGKEIFANRDDFENLDENEFYYVDLIGLDVVDEKNKKIGKVLSVFEHGAGGIVEIEFLEEDLKKEREKIESYPFKNEIFPEVNLKEKFIKIDFPKIVEIR